MCWTSPWIGFPVLHGNKPGHCRPRKALVQVWMSWEDSFVKEFSFRKSVSWMPPGFRTITMWGLVSAAAESMPR